MQSISSLGGEGGESSSSKVTHEEDASALHASTNHRAHPAPASSLPPSTSASGSPVGGRVSSILDEGLSRSSPPQPEESSQQHRPRSKHEPPEGQESMPAGDRDSEKQSDDEALASARPSGDGGRFDSPLFLGHGGSKPARHHESVYGSAQCESGVATPRYSGGGGGRDADGGRSSLMLDASFGSLAAAGSAGAGGAFRMARCSSGSNLHHLQRPGTPSSARGGGSDGGIGSLTRFLAQHQLQTYAAAIFAAGFEDVRDLPALCRDRALLASLVVLPGHQAKLSRVVNDHMHALTARQRREQQQQQQQQHLSLHPAHQASSRPRHASTLRRSGSFGRIESQGDVFSPFGAAAASGGRRNSNAGDGGAVGSGALPHSSSGPEMSSSQATPSPTGPSLSGHRQRGGEGGREGRWTMQDAAESLHDGGSVPSDGALFGNMTSPPTQQQQRRLANRHNPHRAAATPYAHHPAALLPISPMDSLRPEGSDRDGGLLSPQHYRRHPTDDHGQPFAITGHNDGNGPVSSSRQSAASPAARSPRDRALTLMGEAERDGTIVDCADRSLLVTSRTRNTTAGRRVVVRRHADVKFVVVGRGGVGKTSLIHRLVNSNFQPHVKCTLGVEFSSKVVPVRRFFTSQRPGCPPKEFEIVTDVTLQFWDIAGQEDCGNATRTYYHGAKAAIVVYDVTSPSSLAAALRWKRDLEAKVRFPSCGLDIPAILIGNKIDALPYVLPLRRRTGSRRGSLTKGSSAAGAGGMLSAGTLSSGEHPEGTSPGGDGASDRDPTPVSPVSSSMYVSPRASAMLSGTRVSTRTSLGVVSRGGRSSDHGPPVPREDLPETADEVASLINRHHFAGHFFASAKTGARVEDLCDYALMCVLKMDPHGTDEVPAAVIDDPRLATSLNPGAASPSPSPIRGRIEIGRAAGGAHQQQSTQQGNKKHLRLSARCMVL